MLRSLVNPRGVHCIISGGGMPQIEHAIGTIKAIYAHELCQFDTMAGTSAGALVSSLNMSYDQHIEQLEELIKTTPVDKWFRVKPWQMLKSVVGLSNYCVDNTGLKDFLIHAITAESIPRVQCAVTEMVHGFVDKPILCDGQPRHVLASMSFQNIFPPVVWDGKEHADGGVFNNVPLPPFKELEEYAHVYIILPPRIDLIPSNTKWSYLNKFCNLINCSLRREIAQIYEMGVADLPNVTIFQPDKWVDSARFLNWSPKFRQIEASFDHALNVLERKFR